MGKISKAVGFALEHAEGENEFILVNTLSGRRFPFTYRASKTFDAGPGFKTESPWSGPAEEGASQRVAALLHHSLGRTLSLNDVPEVRHLFSAFRIEAVSTSYSVARGDRQTKARELLISSPG